MVWPQMLMGGLEVSADPALGDTESNDWAVAARRPSVHLSDPVKSLLERLERGLGGRYTFEREPGQGGMAIVFLARDLRHDRQVACWYALPSDAMGPVALAGPRRSTSLLAVSKPSRPPHAARVTVHVLDYPCGHFVSEDMWLDCCLSSRGEIGELRHTATENHHVRVQHVDNSCERTPEALDVPV